jgi:hypothetical protein
MIKNELNDSETNKEFVIDFTYKSKDIFYYLFSDLKYNYNEYGDDFILNSYYDKYYTVENDYIKIFYSCESGPVDIIDVTINKYSNKYYLCNYIGKYFNEVLNDFDNEYEISYPQKGGVDLKCYEFKNDELKCWIDFYIEDNDVIYEIVYRKYGNIN